MYRPSARRSLWLTKCRPSEPLGFVCGTPTRYQPAEYAKEAKISGVQIAGTNDLIVLKVEYYPGVQYFHPIFGYVGRFLLGAVQPNPCSGCETTPLNPHKRVRW